MSETKKTDKKAEKQTLDTKFVNVKFTEQGRSKIIELLQNSIGYIEEEIHEQILNDLQEWMNTNYGQLLDFYVKAIGKGLVPATQLHEVVEENNALREKLGITPRKEKGVEDTLQIPIDTTSTIETDTAVDIDGKKHIPPEKTPIVKSSPKKSVIEKINKEEKFKPLDKMGGWELRKLAKKMGLPVVKGMNKDMIFEMVQDKIKEDKKL